MIVKYHNIREELRALRRDGLPQGFNTGWEGVDKYFRPMKGYFCVLTGVPGHGKSEFFDCLMINLSLMHQWKWCVFSPENYPLALHFNKLAEKIIGKPQRKASEAEYQSAIEFLDEHFTFLYPKSDSVQMDEILDAVSDVKETYGADGFVIDPWNELDHTRRTASTETEHIDRSLSKYRKFCREKELFGTIIAHPTKMQPQRDGTMPKLSLWSISGSAAWRNKADFGLIVVRDDMTKNEPRLEIHKIKQKNFGKVGAVQMYYDIWSGKMSDQPMVYGHEYSQTA